MGTSAWDPSVGQSVPKATFARSIALYQPHPQRVEGRFIACVGDRHLYVNHVWCLSWRKRIMDTFGASVLLLLAAPLLLIIAVAIVADSPGPVFFLQWRTGYGGQRFRIFKFRTMFTNAEALKATLRPLSHHGLDSPDFKVRNDPRVTRVGRLLRRYSLDEIPNLINVVYGDMSLVGPRPTSFDIDQYEDWHLQRLAVLPGVTGLWQIAGRSDIGFDDRVKLDCRYIDGQSFWLDTKILGLTPLRVLGGRGAC